jgi:histidinol-phosphate phosphatase family protein
MTHLVTPHIKQAVYLVGGKGTRLGKLTADTPKPLLEIAPGVRFLDHILAEAARYGFADIILLAGHLGDQVEAAYHGRRFHEAEVRVIRELQPQGTGGALALAHRQLDPWFLMGNGDSLFEFNLRALALEPRQGMKARLALRQVPDPSRYGAVQLEDDRICGFYEKSATLSGPMPINGGVYLLSRDVADMVTGPCSIEQDIFPRLVEQSAIDGHIFDGYFLDIGLPDTYAQACAEIPQRTRRPIAFLDRDGVLNHDNGYTHRPEDLVWMPNAKSAIRALNEANYYTIVVTNQAGIARGLYAPEAVNRFHKRMQEDLALVGGHIDAFYMCPFHPKAVVDQYRATDHPDRKPNAGMLLKAMQDWPPNKAKSFLIGDRDSDIAAANKVGIPGYLFDGKDLHELVERALEDVRKEQK